MKRTLPLALFRMLRTLSSVSPIWLPTRSLLSTLITSPWERMPMDAYISPMKAATVVFPVPGLPVKIMCSGGISPPSPDWILMFKSLTKFMCDSMLRLTSPSPISCLSPAMPRDCVVFLRLGMSSGSMVMSCSSVGELTDESLCAMLSVTIWSMRLLTNRPLPNFSSFMLSSRLITA